MSIFHFHLHECGNSTMDSEGRDLPNIETAIIIAVEAARDIMAEEVRLGKLCLSCHIDVEDEHGGQVAHVTFREAIVVSGRN